MDVVLLSRLQFALTIMFHYLFPPLTIGLGLVLVYLGWRHLRTGESIYHDAQRFWIRIFALTFAIGVATGIVMEFEFGTNWATYSRFVGDVFGSALAAEGIFAFFLESGFLAVLVFGADRVSKRMHFFSTCMVALGSIFSSIWIVVANSWQQTPAGSHIVPITRDGQPWVVGGEVMYRAEITDFGAMVFNPSTVHRLTHVLLGCFVMGAFFVMSISAWYVLKGRHLEFARRSFRGALVLGAVSSVALLFSGHLQAKNVYEHQPAKLAAFEGHYETGRGDLSLIGLPDDDAQRLRFNVAIPGGLSFLLHESFSEQVVGLDRIRPEDRPPTLIPFATYHLMVGIGTFFIVLTLASCFWLWRGTLFDKRWLMWVFVLAVVPAVLANQAGWVAAEVGRQPWIVHPQVLHDADGGFVLDEDGYVAYDATHVEPGAPIGLRTSDGVSTAIRGEQVLWSIIGFGLIYTLLGAIWVMVLHQKIQAGPRITSEAEDTPPPPGEGEGFAEVAADRPSHRESLTEGRGRP